MLHGPKHRLKDKIELTAISPTGHKVALISKRKFWIFGTSPVDTICTGEFTRGGTTFQYARGDQQLEIQHPIMDVNVLAFSAVALCDQYLVIGTPGHVMIFIVHGEFVGRWVASYRTTYDEHASIERLTFSRDSAQLLALLRASVGHTGQVRCLIFD